MTPLVKCLKHSVKFESARGFTMVLHFFVVPVGYLSTGYRRFTNQKFSTGFGIIPIDDIFM